MHTQKLQSDNIYFIFTVYKMFKVYDLSSSVCVLFVADNINDCQCQNSVAVSESSLIDNLPATTVMKKTFMTKTYDTFWAEDAWENLN